jgi:predicted NAD-dependent protein-ADP-ribosyltransferase YbiA (DUF1768 family)
MPRDRFAYTVILTYAFPVDMLRYDCAWPDSSEDARIIVASQDPATVRAARQAGTPLKVRIVGTKHPTFDRWSSFGATVMRDSLEVFKV